MNLHSMAERSQQPAATSAEYEEEGTASSRRSGTSSEVSASPSSNDLSSPVDASDPLTFTMSGRDEVRVRMVLDAGIDHWSRDSTPTLYVADSVDVTATRSYHGRWDSNDLSVAIFRVPRADLVNHRRRAQVAVFELGEQSIWPFRDRSRYYCPDDLYWHIFLEHRAGELVGYRWGCS